MSGFSPDHAGADVRVSPNFGPRAGVSRPDMIILHYTGMETGEAPRRGSAAPESQVSSHYLVHEDGRIVQMVRESDRAWHAGKSFWRGAHRHQLAFRRHRDRQSGARARLPRFSTAADRRGHRALPGIIARHGILPQRVLAHSDVAPGRKIDPGEKFPWRKLARSRRRPFCRAGARRQASRCFSPATSGAAVEELQSMLSLYGYGIDITGRYDEPTGVVVAAFQRHFRPRRVDGLADRSTVETLRRLLQALPHETT